MDDVLTIIKKRKSIRKYKDKEVPDLLIKKLIESASYAPSGMNFQPWRFIVIKNKETKKEIRKLYDLARKNLNLYLQDTSFLENATLIFACCENKPFNINSVFMAIQNLLLQATAFGLGSLIATCTTEPEANKKLKALLNIPLDIALVALVAVGYADENPEPKERKKDIFCYDKWGF